MCAHPDSGCAHISVSGARAWKSACKTLLRKCALFTTHWVYVERTYRRGARSSSLCAHRERLLSFGRCICCALRPQQRRLCPKSCTHVMASAARISRTAATCLSPAESMAKACTATLMLVARVVLQAASRSSARQRRRARHRRWRAQRSGRRMKMPRRNRTHCRASSERLRLQSDRAASLAPALHLH